jgi:hypothetical protein
MKKKKFEQLLTRMDFILERLADIEFAIEHKLNKDVPTPPPFKQWDEVPLPYISSKSCSKCGLKLDSAMGYVCNDSQCPTFPMVTSVTLVNSTSSVEQSNRMTNPGNLDYDV